MNRRTNIRLFSLLLTICAALGCGCAARPQAIIQPQKRMIYEPVRFEDGTLVSDDKEAEALFEKDAVQTDTTFAENGDTLLTVRHTGAFMRIQLEGLPTDAGIDHILLVPMRGEVMDLPVTIPASGPLVIWQAKTPGWIRPAAAIATAKDGRIWSARLKGQTLRAGTAYRWDATVVTPEPPAPGLTAKVLSSTALPDIEDGEYSGITWLSGNNYAVVDNDQKGGGILHFTIPIDNSGYVGDVSMRPAAGTVVSTDKNRDNEGITYVPSLGTLYVSSERHQEIREYDLAGRATGKALQIPSDLAVKAITSNRGFEALTFNNATGLFWTMTEAPLAKDTFLPRILRLQSFGTDGKPANRFLYQTGKPTKSAESASSYVFGVSCMAAMDDGRILVLEREVFVPKGNVLNKVRTAFTKMNLYVVDPVHDSAGILRKSLVCSFKTNALDLANFEGMCLGPTLPDGRRCLVLIADSQRGAGGLTQEYVKVILLK